MRTSAISASCSGTKFLALSLTATQLGTCFQQLAKWHSALALPCHERSAPLLHRLTQSSGEGSPSSSKTTGRANVRKAISLELCVVVLYDSLGGPQVASRPYLVDISIVKGTRARARARARAGGPLVSVTSRPLRPEKSNAN